jgi:glycosyltransferase involved in cell wall biosynthesis
MRVLAFVQKRLGRSPGQRFRFEQWAPHLKERHGIELDFTVFESDKLGEVLYQPGQVLTKGALMLEAFARRTGGLRRAQDYDAVAVYREIATIGPAVYERVLAQIGKPIIFDFDDSIWMQNPTTNTAVNGLFSRLRFPGKTRTITRLASAVTVGNKYLAEWAGELNSEVHVVPSSIELATYAVQPELTEEDPFVIGWMGSFSTLPHLECLRSAVERFAAKRRVRFLVVCDRPIEPAFKNAETVFVRWSAEREAADIGAMHVGVMPLVDYDVSRGKCGMKALQYMASGRPCVVTPIGVNADIIEHGRNGFHASNEDEWVEAFEKLAASRELRRAFAEAGRKTVETAFSAETSAARFARAVAAATASKRSRN